MTDPTALSGTEYLLRVEGVNMDAFVFNSRNLSAIRGASLTLLNAIPSLIEVGGPLEGARALSQGASMGLFIVQPTVNQSEEDLRKEVEKWLKQKYPHATFVVDLCLRQGDFRQQGESLLAANRWRQAMGASLSIPPVNSQTWELKAQKPACGLEGKRPAVFGDGYGTPNRGKDTASFLSEALKKQFNYGRTAREAFYQDRTKLKTLPEFAENFEQIVKGLQELPNKMAVFYADGNRFGSVQRAKCGDETAQEAWDEAIRSQRETFLRSFLEEVRAQAEWLTQDGELRFETLLWGGDELMFVMPAKLGWRFASRFFSLLEDMAFAGETLTHTASLVFCHHHSPIERIKDLAKYEIAEFAKQADGGRYRNQLMVLPLESYDTLGEGLQEGLNRRYGDRISLDELILKSVRPDEPLSAVLKGLAELRTSLREENSGFARSQLRTLVHTLLSRDRPTAEDLAQLTSTKAGSAKLAFKNLDSSARERLQEEWMNRFSCPVAAWIQLEEFWDYAIL